LKKFKEVELTRKKYHKDPSLNSVHRSSLMVPELDDCIAEISFLNHFLIKRNHKKIACIITAIGKDGKKIESRLHHIDQPKVYAFTLTGMVEESVSNYMIEFFSPDNLFIPFPAVMVNHRNSKFLNQVHSFNRVLNDIFEDDDINKNPVKESSVDLILNDNTDTCLLFTAGPIDCKGSLEIEIGTPSKTYKTVKALDIPRFGYKKISLRENFKELPDGVKGIIKAKQPNQLLFYGRLISGQWLNDKTFSANHSYYDSSTTEEYWDNTKPSDRQYPFFSNFKNGIKIYPILSPSELEIILYANSNNGKEIFSEKVGVVTSPSNEFVDTDINTIFDDAGIDVSTISSFGVRAQRINDSKIPTRIGHQLIYGAGGLNTSINVVLGNPNVFTPEGKKSMKWGQIVVGGGFDTFFAITADSKENKEITSHVANITFYDKNGKLEERKVDVLNGTSVKSEASNEFKEFIDYEKPQYIWCSIESENHGLNFFAATYNTQTKHCSGDHGF